MEDLQGTPIYMAPEIFLDEPYTYKVDVYAFSLIMYELITETSPFKEYKGSYKLFKDTKNGVRPELPKTLDEKVTEFIKKCWSNDPSVRPPFSEIVEFIQQENFCKLFEIDQDELTNYLKKFNDDLKKPFLFMDFDVKKASEEGNVIATHFMGIKYLFGIGVEKNSKEAAHYFEKASNLGDPESMFNYARMLEKGTDIECDYEKAVYYYEKAIELGNVNAMVNLAFMLREGKGIKVDKEKAAKYFKMAADKGDIESMNCYGILISSDSFKNKNVNEASHYLKSAADLGSTYAMNNYGSLLLAERIGTDYKKQAAAYFNKSASNGNAYANLLYGLMLWKGYGVKRNAKEAEKYFNKFIDLSKDKEYGIVSEYYQIISFKKEDILTYLKSLGNDPKKSDDLLKYGICQFINGQSLIDFTELFEDYQRSASLGNTDSMFACGLMLVKGIGTQTNEKEGINLIQKAADRGSICAMLDYSSRSKDKAISLKYLQMAADFKIEQSEIDLFKKETFKSINNEQLNEMIILKGNELINGYKKTNDIFSIVHYYSKIDSVFLYANMLLFSNEKEKGVSYLKKGIELGDCKSMLRYGLMLQEGKEIPMNEEESLKYIKMAADKQNVVAIGHYGRFLYNGLGKIKPNQKEGVKYVKLAADKKDPESMILYGLILRTGKVVPMNKKEAVKYFKMAVNCNYPKAYHIYGIALFQGDGIPKNIKEAIKNWKKGIELNNSDCALAYSEMLLEGKGVPQNKKEGLQILKKFADKGDKIASFRYAEHLFNGDGIQKDDNEAFKYFTISAENNNPDAMVRLGFMYLNGEVVPPNKEKAIYYLKKSASCGIDGACFLYGYFLLKGDGVPCDIIEGVKYIRKSIDEDYIYAILHYSYLLYTGEGVEVNKKESEEYLKRAIKKDGIKSLSTYSNFLQSGSFVQKDLKAALFFLRKAADFGDVNSAYDYAILALTEEGIVENKLVAFKYLQIAANHGNLKAKSLLSKHNIENLDFSEETEENDVSDYDKKSEEELNKLKIEADNGNYNSAFFYGRYLLSTNKSEAVKYIKMAADNLNIEAARFLADLYHEGIGVKQNESQSIKYYKIAADNGDAYSMGKYASFLLKKKTRKDSLEAAKYYKKSADLEFEDSCFFYAFLLLEGEYVIKDEKEAARYLRIGADKGHSLCLQLYSVLLYDGVN